MIYIYTYIYIYMYIYIYLHKALHRSLVARVAHLRDGRWRGRGGMCSSGVGALHATVLFRFVL